LSYKDNFLFDVILFGQIIAHDYPHMTATIKLNLTDALTHEELDSLIAKATREQKSLERVIYEAAIAAIRPQTTSMSDAA